MFSVISRSVALSLQQSLSISNAVLKNAFEDFKSNSNLEVSEKSFIKFCTARFSCSEPVLPINWRPSTFAIGTIPLEVVKAELFPLFMRAYEGKCIAPDYDQFFQEFCANHWGIDCRNSATKWSTFMKRDWQPSLQTKNEIQTYLSADEAELLIAEFRLFWKDSGQSSNDWESKLLDWVNNYRQAEF